MDNPHERRGGSSVTDFKAFAMTAGHPMYERPRSFLTLADLDVMAQSAAGRACDELKRKLEREHDEETRVAQLRAWDDGHNRGVEGGERLLLMRIDEQHGEQVRQLIDDTRELFGRDGVEPVMLKARLLTAVQLLESLVQAHHDGFPAQPPF